MATFDRQVPAGFNQRQDETTDKKRNREGCVNGEENVSRTRDQSDYLSGDEPPLVHRFQHNTSILCLATTEEFVFAGTQAGEILVSLYPSK